MIGAWNSVLAAILLVHLALTTGILMVGIAGYVLFAPYRELKLIRKGNVANAPLAAMLATSILGSLL
jgi:uncharacterized membrane protein YjfL (UPF0719 family)